MCVGAVAYYIFQIRPFVHSVQLVSSLVLIRVAWGWERHLQYGEGAPFVSEASAAVVWKHHLHLPPSKPPRKLQPANLWLKHTLMWVSCSPAKWMLSIYKHVSVRPFLDALPQPVPPRLRYC